ncbi:hypothetical protein Fmac_025171 [Flemingia macrophylla]|uniref:At4g15545-like C-terminal domain-containing protein n=1 Tax=Flemingia macrophylla TaxID=520843 RepID=A0ABD1LRG2_9FABA
MTHHHSLLLKRTVLPHVVDLLVLVSLVLAFYYRSRLSYKQFSAFLANIKELNAQKQTRETSPFPPDVFVDFETSGFELLSASKRIATSSTPLSTSSPLQCLQARRCLSASELVATATSSSRTATMSRLHRSLLAPWTSPRAALTRVQPF